MAVDVIMPQMGESIFEGTITKWLKKAGDKIERDEPLFEISTDKVDAEIPSPSAGVLKEIKVGEGQTVPIQTVVAVIEAGDGASSCPPPPAAAPAKPAAAPSGRAASAAPQNPPRLLPRVSCRNLRPPLPAVKKFAALRSSAKSRAKIILTSRRFPAPAPADASARATSSAPCKVVAHRRPSAGAPASAPASPPRGVHQPPAAQALPPFLKTPSRAKKCISAITKSSPCPSCASASPSTWCSRSTSPRTSIPWTKRT